MNQEETSEMNKEENRTPETVEHHETETHDAEWYAKSAYECFIANADKDTSDADPVAAIRRVFEERASEQLKEQVAAEGKTAEGAFQFLWAIARLCKQTDGGCHISPETGYAISMHYFQDVPASVIDEYEPAMKKQKQERIKAEAKERAAKLAAEASEKAKKAKEKAQKAKAKKEEKAKQNKENPPTPVAEDTAATQHQPAPEGVSTESEYKPVTEQVKPSDTPQKTLKPAHEQSSFFDGLFAQ